MTIDRPPDILVPSDHRSCIYLFRNRINGKVYVGQTLDMWRRYREHKMKGAHGEKLKRAIAKYGFDAFDLYVLEVIERVADKKVLQETMNAREQFYLDHYRSYEDDKGYNILRLAGSAIGWTHTPEQRAKLLANTPHPKGPDSAWWGRKHTPEALKMLSEGRKGKMGHRRRVKQIDPDTGEVIRVWETIKEAGIALGIKSSGITAAARGRSSVNGKTGKVHKRTRAAGYRWEYEGDMVLGEISCEEIKRLTEEGNKPPAI